MKNRFFLEVSMVLLFLILLFTCFILEPEISGYVVFDDEKGVPSTSDIPEEDYSNDSPISGINNLEIQSLENITLNQEDSKEIDLKVRNGGVNYLNDCEIKTSEVYSSWISTEDSKGLAPGEKHEFLFELSALEPLNKEKQKIPVIVSCDEINKSVNLLVDVIKKNFEIEIIDIKQTDQRKINLTYSLKELVEEDSYVDVELVLMDSSGEVLRKSNEVINLEKNSEIIKSRIISLEELNENEIKVVLNADSKKYSSFVLENVLINSEKSISGFSVSDKRIDSDNVLSFLIISVFLVFGYFVLRRIIRYRKKVIVEE